jgi:glycosyltransferase involved in cell wall biosynthesis
MLSKKPILYSYSGSHDFVKLTCAGISIPAESPQAVADAILELKSITQERINKMGKNGRKYALENLDYEKLAKTLSKALD